VICDLCDQEMEEAASCNVGVLHLAGEPYPVFPHGSDRGWGPTKDRCGDCNVLPGGYHHVGCDIQVCPRCRGQLITCDCPWDELTVERADHHDAGDDDAWGDPAWDDGLARVVRLPGLDRVPAGPVRTAPPLLPFGAAAAPYRARHHAALQRLAAWALARGRPCDLDQAALCVEAIEEIRGPEGLRLDRPDVCGVLSARVPTLASLLRTLIPLELPVHLWSVVVWLHDEGGLAPGSAPLSVLLEPLGCYAGLGADGLPMVPDDDVDFPCQCQLPHDPTCPPGLAQHVLGEDPVTGEPVVVRARLRLRKEVPSIASHQPLFAFARRHRQERPHAELHVDDYTFLGTVDGSGSTPQLWLYHRDDERRGEIAVDADGHRWAPRPDRRRKIGFRWVQDDWAYLFGADLVLEHPSRRRRSRW
jgi:hypothetical protein